MEKMSMKTATHNRFEVLSISFSKKWALILVLAPIVLSGILLPISFSYKNINFAETTGVMLTKFSVARAAESPVQRGGVWYYGGKAYKNYIEAIGAQGERESGRG